VTWRLVDDREALDGPWNMAVDEALFEAVETGRSDQPLLRLYTWVPATLSLGYHQPYATSCDPAFLAERGFGLVRRPTGGKAVLHQDEITYCVVAPLTGPFAGSLVETYAKVAAALAAGLSRLGLPVTLKERALAVAPGTAAPCFLVPSEKEILVDGRKVVGSAQRRGQRAFLQHGAVPLTLDYEALARATADPEADLALYRRAFAGLADLRPGLGAEEVRRHLSLGFSQQFPGPWEDRPLEEDERSRAAALVRERFGTEAWTRRC